MATAAKVPVEVYLTSMFEPDAEYVDGHIQERAMGSFPFLKVVCKHPPKVS